MDGAVVGDGAGLDPGHETGPGVSHADRRERKEREERGEIGEKLEIHHDIVSPRREVRHAGKDLRPEERAVGRVDREDAVERAQAAGELEVGPERQEMDLRAGVAPSDRLEQRPGADQASHPEELEKEDSTRPLASGGAGGQTQEENEGKEDRAGQGAERTVQQPKRCGIHAESVFPSGIAGRDTRS